MFSLGFVLIFGFLFGYLFKKIKLPSLVGMLLVGIIFGPSVLKVIGVNEDITYISQFLRQLALIIILTRSGLNLDLESLKKIGRPAILMCFLPATFEILGISLFGHLLLNITWIESLLLGSVLAAVSPAVVSPRMIKLIEEGYGNNHNVPKLILAGSSMDDIYVIILFYAFLGILENNSFDILSIIKIPTSIIFGILLGIIAGYILSIIFKKIKLNISSSILITLSISCLLIALDEIVITKYINISWLGISSLLSIMVLSITLLFKNKEKANELSKGYNHCWTIFEVILFVLVGAKLNISSINSSIFMGILVIIIGLIFRSIGVLFCLIKTELTFKERLFCVIAYIPKATVQASIGCIAFDMGLDPNGIILEISIISILLTASIGALLIDILAPKLLEKKQII